MGFENDSSLAMLEQSEERQRVQEVMAKLPSKQRLVLELYYFRQLSYEKIGSELQMPLGSVGVTLKRAEKKLKQMLIDSNP